MMERVRILLVAAPTAPVRGLASRLQDPDIDVMSAASAREALERAMAAMPDVVVIDGSMPGREVFRLYGRLRGSAAGAAVPIIFSHHERSEADAVPTTAPDYYLPADASLDEIEQLIYTFLPEALFEEPPAPAGPGGPAGPSGPPWPGARPGPDAGDGPAADRTAGPDAPRPATILAGLRSGPAPVALAYLGLYLAAEVLAAAVDARLGLVAHAGLLAATFFHGANVPTGPERAFFWALWLAPLTRIYGLAQPFAGAPPLAWWALTAIPMVVAAVVAMRLTGQAARDAGLVPQPREVPIAVFMVPVGLALGVLAYLLLEPRALGRELAFGGPALAALVVVLNPGLVDEIVFRGILQRAATSVLGRGGAIGYTALLYAPVVPAGLAPGSSLLAAALTFGIGLLLAVLTARTGSIISAAVAHASLAVGLVVVAPYVLPGGLTGSGAAPTPAADVRSPTPLPPPALTPAAPPTRAPVAPPPTQPPPAQAPAAPTPQPPTSTAAPPAGQPPAALPPTPAALATPLPPQPTAPAGGAPSAGATPAPGGQIVVVRGTGGAGARLRAQPGNSGAIVTVVPEYTPLIVIGPDRIVDGVTWRNVRASPGGDGWIAASFVTAGGAP